ncbi:hypothetical protein BX616_008984, partial [Lobosporangium transversale]
MPEGLLDSRYNVRGSIREFYPVELVLTELVLAVRRMRLPVDYSLLRFMANEIYTMLSLRNAGSVDLAKLAPQIANIKKITSQFSLADIYNADETDLFLQTVTQWTFDPAEELKAGTKPASSRVSILFCSNALGTDKRKPFIM